MLLRIYSLYKSFGPNTIFEDFDFQINYDQIKIIVGNNGCGKSTLFNVLSGISSYHKGSILLEGKNIKKFKPYQISQLGIARTFQNGGLLNNLTLEENLILTIQSQSKMTFFQKLLPINKNKYKTQINGILDSIKLTELINQKASSLSTGQARLLELKKLELQKAKLYLIDEPTAGVNPKMFPLIIDLITKLNKIGAVLIIEHNQEFIKMFDCEVFEIITK